MRSDIILRDELEPALDAIEGFSHVIVVFHIDRVPEEAQRLQIAVGTRSSRRNEASWQRAASCVPTRSARPWCKVLHRRKGVLRVQGLDALDGTPVLDIKPYLPEYDSVPDAQLPPWAVRRDAT